MSGVDGNFLFNIVLIAWTVVELSFWVFLQYILVPQFQYVNAPPPYKIPCETLVCRTLDLIDSLPKSYNFEKFVYGFFRGAKKHEVYEENMRSFLSWAMFGIPLDRIKAVQIEQLDRMLVEVYRRHGKLKAGFNSEVKHVSMTYDPISFIHRPLLVYIGVSITERVFNGLYFRFQGYRRHKLDSVTYWYRPSSNPSSGLDPLLVFHGIAPGWMLYAQLAENLAYGGRAVYLINLSAAQIKSLRFKMLSIEDYSRICLNILHRHGGKKASIVGHSFGTITAGWFVTAHPEAVSHITLIDPVALLLSLPDVSHAFLYHKPSTFTEWVIYLFAAKELTIAHMLSRQFWWYNNVLFLEDIPNNIGVLVGISGGDEVLHAPSHVEYLDNCKSARESSRETDVRPIVPLYWEGFSHGQVLVSSTALKAISSALKKAEAH